MSVDPSWFQGPTAQAIREEGRKEAAVQHILESLEIRGISISAADRSKVSACRDIDLLREWFRRSITAKTVDDLFTGIKESN
ncbi:hypothetical protein [Nocardia arthritidis]|uniref:Uncharacterized protein n=1 Tax=Nocardia arthritidis TaxID=228602 RepID=A0A6G9YPG6_9NOCA|nr:hypothetical protein [Nocardia arthritidis]QIS15081.1 hypothetical protein F5544_36260 [Nocardia arthritidis]